MRWRKYIQILSIIGLLYFFYYLGLPLYYLGLIGIMSILLILLKGKIYRKLEGYINKKFPKISEQPSWIKKLIIIGLFVIIYILIKQVIFTFLKMVGIDIQKIILENLNKSVGN